MKWSWTLGRVFGIKLRMHWTFLLLLAWVGFSYAAHGGLPAALEGIAFLAAVFACVILHECGHAVMARQFGVQTEDITLLPIGGLARMQRIPREPMHEFWIAVAGPMVNVVIALLIFVSIILFRGFRGAMATPTWGESFFLNLMWVNVILVVFNVLPAFPMDGGRVLRALLATQIDYLRATRIAANIGQAVAIMFGFIGLFMNPFLLFIAIFVYLGAEAETQMVELRDLLQGLKVRDGMMVRFRTLSSDDTLQQATDELLAGSQHDFPVLSEGRYLGLLSRQNLIQGLREEGIESPVEKWVSEEVTPIGETGSLIETFEEMKKRNFTSVPVVVNEQLVGLLCLENISELLMIRSATGDRGLPHAGPQLVESI